MRKSLLLAVVTMTLATLAFGTPELEEAEMQKDLAALEELSKMRLQRAVKLPKQPKVVTEIECVKCDFRSSK